MNRKTTKRALLTSLMALVLCVSMFIGTTFAWFTDSVTSSKNKIVAGNLDVELYYLVVDENGTKEWKPVGENTNVFMENTLWEPGHTETVYLKVVNAGSLAFDYKLGVNIFSEVSSVNVYNKPFSLSDHIVMGAVEDVDTPYGSRAEARDALDLDEVKAIGKGYATAGTLYPASNMPTDIPGAASEECLALVVYMPETVGNEANYKNGLDENGVAIPAPEVVLGINVLATQETYENDSFDDQYDAGALTTAPAVPVEEGTANVILWNEFDDTKPSGEEELTFNMYEFNIVNYTNTYPLETYKGWTCDFFVSTEDGKAVDDGIILAGTYADYPWIGIWVPESDEAYEDVGLLGVVSYGGESNWTYQGIHDEVQIFRCGIIDHDGKNAGTKVTVELRMTSPDKSETITVTSITVTL